MISPAFLVVAAMTFVALIILGWLSLPNDPDLDGERLFKVILATLLRGEFEAADGTVEEWEKKVLEWIPFHPAGRMPEVKLKAPSLHSLPGAALDGEQALVEALSAIDSYPARLRRMYDEDEMGLEARLMDPNDLGADYDLATLVAPAVTWDSLALWGGGESSLDDRLMGQADVHWVLVDGRPDGVQMPSILADLSQQLGERALRVSWDHVDLEAGRLAVKAAAQRLMLTPSQRLVFVGEEAGIQLVLGVMAASAPLRDRVLAVVSIGGVLGGIDPEGELSEANLSDWMEAWFQHRRLDTEIIRMTPYFACQWLDRDVQPPGIKGLPLQASRFPEPKEDSTVPPAIQSVDLGPLWVGDTPPTDQIAKALRAFLACWLSSNH